MIPAWTWTFRAEWGCQLSIDIAREGDPDEITVNLIHLELLLHITILLSINPTTALDVWCNGVTFTGMNLRGFTFCRFLARWKHRLKRLQLSSHLLDGPSAVFLQLEAYGGICREKLQLKNSLLYPSLLFYLSEHHSWYCTRTFKQQASECTNATGLCMGDAFQLTAAAWSWGSHYPTLQSLQTPSTKHVPLSCSFCLFYSFVPDYHSACHSRLTLSDSTREEVRSTIPKDQH